MPIDYKGIFLPTVSKTFEPAIEPVGDKDSTKYNYELALFSSQSQHPEMCKVVVRFITCTQL